MGEKSRAFSKIIKVSQKIFARGAQGTLQRLSGELRDGKIFGRGACDDKYALATVLFIIKLLKEKGFAPKENLVFSAYGDEEYGGSHGALAAVLKTPCERIVNMDGREDQIWHCASGGGEVKYTYHTKVDFCRWQKSS